MKLKFLICSIFLLSVNFLIAQTSCGQVNCSSLLNGNFTGINPNCWNPSEGFVFGCVPFWESSHGGPDYIQSGGNSYAKLVDHNGLGQGLHHDFQFKKDRDYTISFCTKIENLSGNRVEFYAANNVPTAPIWNLGLDWLPAVSPRQPIGDIGAGNFSNWTYVEFTFTANDDYESLWFYPREYGIGGAPIVMWIDNVCVEDVCVDNHSSAFTFNAVCDEQNGLSVIATANDNTLPNNLFKLYEVSTPGATSGGTVVAEYGHTQTATFSQVEFGHHYYIKHGIWGGCIPKWRETRQAVHIPLGFFNNQISPAFTHTATCDGTNGLSVTAVASDPSAPQDNWQIYQTVTPGSPVGAILIAGPITWGNQVTFDNLQTNTEYYIKHGVDGDCYSWQEDRDYFTYDRSQFSGNFSADFYVSNGVCNQEDFYSVTATAVGPLAETNEWTLLDGVTGNVIQGPFYDTPSRYFGGLVLDKAYIIKHVTFGECTDALEVNRWVYNDCMSLPACCNAPIPMTTRPAELHNTIVQNEEISSATKDLESASIKLYPNPASDFVTINYPSTTELIQIIDIQGRIVKTINSISESSESKVDISQLQNGVYFVNVLGAQTSQSLKLMITNQ